MARPPPKTNTPLDADPWVARVCRHDFLRTPVVFATGHDLFSSAALDVGTSRLLRTLAGRDDPLAAPAGRPLDLLDLGCGVGVIGLSIALARPEGSVRVVATDRDRLAIHLTRLNALENGLADRPERFQVPEAGFGYEPCRRDGLGPFDRIVSNIPAKAGAAGLKQLLFGAGPLLRPGGVLSFVHVTTLTETIDALRDEFAELHDGPTTILESIGKEHRALHWRFDQGLPAHAPRHELDPWRRPDAPAVLHLKGVRPIPHVAVSDVEEFDTEHFRTPVLTRLAQLVRPVNATARPERILLLNPCHGLLAARLISERHPARIAVCGRDTLELAAARRNIDATLKRWALTGETVLEDPPLLEATPWLPAPSDYDLIAGSLRWKEGKAAHERTLAALCNALSVERNGRLLLSAGVGQIDAVRRLAQKVGLRHGRELKKKGTAAIALRRR